MKECKYSLLTFKYFGTLIPENKKIQLVYALVKNPKSNHVN